VTWADAHLASVPSVSFETRGRMRRSNHTAKQARRNGRGCVACHPRPLPVRPAALAFPTQRRLRDRPAPREIHASAAASPRSRHAGRGGAGGCGAAGGAAGRGGHPLRHRWSLHSRARLRCAHRAAAHRTGRRHHQSPILLPFSSQIQIFGLYVCCLWWWGGGGVVFFLPKPP
jgi:hypothetical protein